MRSGVHCLAFIVFQVQVVQFLIDGDDSILDVEFSESWITLKECPAITPEPWLRTEACKHSRRLRARCMVGMKGEHQAVRCVRSALMLALQ